MLVACHLVDYHFVTPRVIFCYPSGKCSMPPKELTLITGNKGKLAEAQAILNDLVGLKSRSLELTEIQGTITEITSDKCRRAAAIV